MIAFHPSCKFLNHSRPSYFRLVSFRTVHNDAASGWHCMVSMMVCSEQGTGKGLEGSASGLMWGTILHVIAYQERGEVRATWVWKRGGKERNKDHMLGQLVCGSKMECCTCSYDFPSIWYLLPPEASLQHRECFIFVVPNAFPVHLASPLNKMQILY